MSSSDFYDFDTENLLDFDAAPILDFNGFQAKTVRRFEFPALNCLRSDSSTASWLLIRNSSSILQDFHSILASKTRK